ncbi:MAG: hypothetical protein P4L43_16310 [Syntrophobacteraceae bacterium]|nr:hypothetical protein [Syntrophobacteraceae bacterium]
MKLFRLKLLIVALALTLAGFTSFPANSEARGFGGARGASRGFGAGGFSGGSFRGGGGYATGPRGGAAAVGPRGGAAAVGPRGGAAVRGPGGYGAARGPAGGTAARGPGGTYVNGRGAGGAYNANVNVNRGWGAWNGGYYRPGAVAAGVAAGVAVGTAVAALPSAYQTVVVNSQTYYVANGAYYQPCYQGAEVSYCVVASPSP